MEEGPACGSTLRENVWWKSIADDVRAFCESCPTCQVSKPSNHQPYGLLETLEVPKRPWETISIDFVGPLPELKTLQGTFNMILVAIDHLMSMVHLAAMKQTYRAKEVTEVIFSLVYKHHGMPSKMVSDHDTLFSMTPPMRWSLMCLPPNMNLESFPIASRVPLLADKPLVIVEGAEVEGTGSCYKSLRTLTQ